ncbi:MAG: flavin reductase family protein [Candidatus Aenigmatarchaeota archaeon]|nr:MAG: flavin reductase family protein [Candidatus Aenigmarchaeota archaeon]
MNVEYGSEEAHKFVTNVGLVTSDGPHGPNVMACEWTHHVSYEPGLIVINVDAADATADNIRATGEFGVSLAAEDQSVVSSVAGGSHGQSVDKIAVLKEMGVEFYAGKKIKAPMIKGVALSVECRVVETRELGDHVMFVGEAVDVRMSDKPPLVYHGGKYWKVGERVEKPSQDVLESIKRLVEKHRKGA